MTTEAAAPALLVDTAQQTVAAFCEQPKGNPREWIASHLDGVPIWWESTARTEPLAIAAALQPVRAHDVDATQALNAARPALRVRDAENRSDDDCLAELAARHALGEFTPLVAQRLEEIFSLPHDDFEGARGALLNACEHLNVTGEQPEETVGGSQRRM